VQLHANAAVFTVKIRIAKRRSITAELSYPATLWSSRWCSDPTEVSSHLDRLCRPESWLHQAKSSHQAASSKHLATWCSAQSWSYPQALWASWILASSKLP
jgi:hypothetical protein